MYSYKVIKNKLITPTVRSLELRAEDKALLFEPGQYVTISMNQNGRPSTTRCFSVASSPTDRRIIEICARVKGKYTTAMERLAPGAIVTIRGPFGHFVFNEEVHKRLTLFAGGIGITPFMSMIRYAVNLRLENNIHLVYSCRNQNDIPFLEELLLVEKNNPNFQITFVIGGGEINRLENANIIIGKMDEAYLAMLNLRFSEDTFMVCGPAPYMRTVRTMLSTHGVPKERLLSEAFSQGKHGQSDTLRRWPLNMYALAGLSLSVSIFFVAANDLLKTLPALKEQYTRTPQKETNAIPGSKFGIQNNIKAILPQVSTDISQPPIIRHIASTTTGAPVVSAPRPAVTPAPAPTKTITTTVRPRTKVS